MAAIKRNKYIESCVTAYPDARCPFVGTPCAGCAAGDPGACRAVDSAGRVRGFGAPFDGMPPRDAYLMAVAEVDAL